MNKKQWQKYNNAIIGHGIHSVKPGSASRVHQFVNNGRKATHWFMTNFIRSFHKKNIIVDFNVKVENSQDHLPSGNQAIIDIKPFLHINICFVHRDNSFEYRQWFDDQAVINLSARPPFHSQFDYLVKYSSLIRKRQKQLISGFCHSRAKFVHRGHFYVRKINH